VALFANRTEIERELSCLRAPSIFIVSAIYTVIFSVFFAILAILYYQYDIKCTLCYMPTHSIVVFVAVALVRHSNEKNFIILSDSMSSLKALSGFKVDLDVVYSILIDYTRLASNGSISGTVVRVTSFMLFTQTMVDFHTVKTCPGARQWSLTDYELVILALCTCTCLQAKIYQHVSFAVFHSLLITYFWNVPT